MASEIDEKLLDTSTEGEDNCCATVQRAKDYSKAAIARRRNHRYEPLAGNIAVRVLDLPNRGAELDKRSPQFLFVDIMRSTEKAARFGDSRWTQVMSHYYAAVRRGLKTLRGKEVVTTGDGLLATFNAPSAGIRCATAIRQAVRTWGWRSGWGCTRVNIE